MACQKPSDHGQKAAIKGRSPITIIQVMGEWSHSYGSVYWCVKRKWYALSAKGLIEGLKAYIKAANNVRLMALALLKQPRLISNRCGIHASRRKPRDQIHRV